MSVQARVLTQTGIRRAQEFLDELRGHPDRDLDVPHAILFGSECSDSLEGAPSVEHRRMTTRRDAVEYLSALAPPLDQRFVDHWHLWSWLGLFHLPDVLHSGQRKARMSKVYETFVVDPRDSLSQRDSYRHYLWTSWRLHSTFGEQVAYLYSLNIMEVGEILRHIVDSPRIFNSAGVPQLIIRLYTKDARPKRRHQDDPGGIRHLARVLPQLERTYDVYGMSPDALLQILPPIFREWDDVER